MHTNISTWTLQQVDRLTSEILAYINITKYPTSNTSSLWMPNGTLSYGFYKFTFNYTIITNDETAKPFIATTFTYVRIRPTGLFVSGFGVDWGELPITSFTYSFSDTIALIPAYFSYDMDGLTDQKMLTYNFYCMLDDINHLSTNVSKTFNTNLYAVKQGEPITPEQMEATDTCFKDESKLLKKFKLKAI
jgi:hypothetical protein